MSKSAFSAGEYTQCLKDYVEDKTFIRDRKELWNHVQRVFAPDNLGSSRRMRNSFVLLPRDLKDIYVLKVVIKLLLFCLGSRTANDGELYII